MGMENYLPKHKYAPMRQVFWLTFMKMSNLERAAEVERSQKFTMGSFFKRSLEYIQQFQCTAKTASECQQARTPSLSEELALEVSPNLGPW